jgi:hypothetical protein
MMEEGALFVQLSVRGATAAVLLASVPLTAVGALLWWLL